MIRFILAFLLLLNLAFAEDENATVDSTQPATQQESTSEVTAPQPSGPQIVYVSYSDIPNKVVNGEIFSVTVKSLSTNTNYQDISYTFSGGTHVKLINDKTAQTKEGNYFFDTFYFQVTGDNAVLPDMIASAADEQGNEYGTPTTLQGQSLNVLMLNPRSDYANIVAEEFSILTHKVKSYDKDHNIILFTATATRSDLSKIRISNVIKQGIESIDNSFMTPKVTYYAIIDKGQDSFDFSYYNLKDQNFEKVSIPVVVDDDRVTTMSDIAPIDQNQIGLKITLAVILLIAMFAFIMWKKYYKLLLLLIIPIAYIIFLVKPSENMCVKKGTNVYLLPLNNGTVFYKTTTQENLEIEGESGDFRKVKLDNDKIGWVRNADTCSN